MRRKLRLYSNILDLLGVDEGRIPPWWLRAFRYALFPIESTKMVVKKNLDLRDTETQCYKIHGMKLSYTFFATLEQNARDGVWFKFTKMKNGFMDIMMMRDDKAIAPKFTAEMDEKRLDNFRSEIIDSWGEPSIIQTHLHEEEKILVIAGDHQQYKYFMDKHPYLQGLAMYGNDVNGIRGYRLKYVILTGDYWKNPLSRSGDYRKYCDKEFVE